MEDKVNDKFHESQIDKVISEQWSRNRTVHNVE